MAMDQAGLAHRYATRLLNDLGIQAPAPVTVPDLHPALRWQQCGLQALTGYPDRAGEMCPLPLASTADGALVALKTISGQSMNGLQGAHLLTERASLMGLQRNGRIAPGGSCYLLQAQGGRLAVNLPRDEDWAMLPAWLEDGGDIMQGDWAGLAAVLALHSAAELHSRAADMGLAVALDQPLAVPAQWVQRSRLGEPVRHNGPPRVLDLSTLWAGPLATHLLQLCGASVIKLESVQRPDGARQGHQEFFDLLNAGKACLGLDLTDQEGRDQFRQLLQQVDIVIESARPRGLHQLGLDAEALVREQPGLTWLSITAYGREQGHRVGFGDDVGVAAGLSHVMHSVTGEAIFVGDAIADPITGLHAALAALVTFDQGGGVLMDVAMRDVTAYCAGFEAPADEAELRRRHHEWSRHVDAGSATIPAARRPQGRAHALGEDTGEILG